MMILLKTLPTALLASLGKLKVRPLQFGLGISQIGEFSFVLGSIAFAEGVITVSQYTGLLVAVVLSIVFSTIFVRKIGNQ